MSRQTCYVLPLWSGKRRWQHPEIEKDSSFYVREHIKNLQNTKHNLSRICAMIPDNPEPAPQFDEYIKNELPKEINGAIVEVIYRKNIGLSYGGFSDCFGKYKLEYDWYLFQEDDVIYPQDNFDDIWIDHCESWGPRCGFSCSWFAGGLYDGQPCAVHAGIGCGAFRATALHDMYERYGMIGHNNSNAGYVGAERYGQIGMSQMIFANNWCARDLRGTQWRSGFRYAKDGSIGWFGPEDGKILVQPL